MPDVDYDAIHHDLDLRYNGTYVRYRPNSSKPFHTVYIQGINAQPNDFPTLVVIGPSGAELLSYRGEGEFLFSLPEPGYFTYGGNGYLSYYRPSRQNKRSLCASTSVLQNFYTKQRMTLRPRLDWHIANAIYNPTYTPVREAVELLNSRRKYCLSLDREYAVGLSPTDSRSHLLFHYFTPICEINENAEISNLFHVKFERLAYASPVARL